MTLDLLLVGGMTVDRLPGGVRAGGSVIYATELAARLGWRVGVLTTSGEEPEAVEGLRRLRSLASVVEWTPATASVRFLHEPTAAGRRLTAETLAAPIDDPGAAASWSARSILFAPVAGEVSARLVRSLTERVAPRVAAAAIQGWLRRLDVGRPVVPLALLDIDASVTATIRALDLVILSHADVRPLRRDPYATLAELRAWSASSPDVVLTLGARGALLADGRGVRRAAVPRRIVGVPTIGAGDGYAAAVTTLRGAGRSLDAAASRAAVAVAELLAARRRSAR